MFSICVDALQSQRFGYFLIYQESHVQKVFSTVIEISMYSLTYINLLDSCFDNVLAKNLRIS